MELLIVAVGGAFGSLARYLIGLKIAETSGVKFPVGTFFVNITGAIFLGIISSKKLSDNYYILFGDGFLGAYTTFSTFMYEGVNLFQKNEKLNAIVYILGSFALGIIGFIIGIAIVKFL